MSCPKSWHLWRCDGCGKEEQREHGEWAEPAIPSGWRATLGWGVHACSAACQDSIQAKHQAETGKLYLFLDADERTGIIRRPTPAELLAEDSASALPLPTPRRGRPPKVKPGTFG